MSRFIPYSRLFVGTKQIADEKELEKTQQIGAKELSFKDPAAALLPVVVNTNGQELRGLFFWFRSRYYY